LYNLLLEKRKKIDVFSDEYLDKIWHVTPTKVIDNAIIGYNK